MAPPPPPVDDVDVVDRVRPAVPWFLATGQKGVGYQTSDVGNTLRWTSCRGIVEWANLLCPGGCEVERYRGGFGQWQSIGRLAEEVKGRYQDDGRYVW